MYSIYIQGDKYHFSVEDLNNGSARWTSEPVLVLTNPKECYDNGPHEDPDECVVDGVIHVPLSKVSHIIRWN